MTDTGTLSAECAVARTPGYKDLHGQCRQTRDIHLPHSSGVVLMPRCRCTCHGSTR
ncbi:hypothetical protein [Streptomyces sp. DSM 15324]|uniref:hypothetical protein n=1 Tax=Streptomyces sp. DSM 15324 TaxID=1739111 RepID=UPI000A7C0CF4|nr:hypothetical protein [Streptomyces sp. DSM 15324]